MYDVNAAEFSSRAIVTTGTEYDSNPALSENNKNPVWAYKIVPELQVDATSDINHWFLNSALLIQRYSNGKVLVERQDPKFILGWDRTYQSGIYGLKANYQEATSRTLELTSTGVFADKNGTQKTKSIEAMWQHSFNARWSILNEGSYSIFDLSNAGGLGSYNLSELKSKIIFLNSEKLSTYGQIIYTGYHPDSILNDTNLIRLAVGADYQFNERLDIGVRGGIDKVSGNQSETGWEGGIKSIYSPNEKSNYTADLSRTLGAGGIGGFQTVDSIKLTGNYNLSDKNIMGVNYQLNKSRQDSQINAISVDYQQLELFYARVLSPHWEARFTGAHRELSSSNINAQSNLVGVSVTYATLSF